MITYIAYRSFVERWIKNIVVFVVVYWFKFYFPFFGVLVVSEFEALNNSYNPGQNCWDNSIYFLTFTPQSRLL